MKRSRMSASTSQRSMPISKRGSQRSRHATALISATASSSVALAKRVRPATSRVSSMRTFFVAQASSASVTSAHRLRELARRVSSGTANRTPCASIRCVSSQSRSTKHASGTSLAIRSAVQTTWILYAHRSPQRTERGATQREATLGTDRSVLRRTLAAEGVHRQQSRRSRPLSPS